MDPEIRFMLTFGEGCLFRHDRRVLEAENVPYFKKKRDVDEIVGRCGLKRKLWQTSLDVYGRSEVNITFGCTFYW